MALTSSGAISLSDIRSQIGGADKTGSISLNDTECRELFTSGTAIGGSSGSSISMSNFYGGNFFDQDMFDLPNNAMVESGGSSSFTALSLAYIAFAYQKDNNRVRVKQGTGTNSTAVAFNYYNVGVNSDEADTIQVKLTWTGSSTGSGNVTIPTGSQASGQSVNIAEQSTSSNTGSFTAYSWQVQKTSGTGTLEYDAGALSGTGLVTQFTAKDSGGSVFATSDNSPTETIFVRCTRSGGGFPGQPPGFPPPGDFCLHEDMLVNTEWGPMSIKDVADKDPKIWAYNWNKKQKELVDQNSNVQVLHNNLYIINNEFKITEDHVMYGENHEQYSIEPELALKKYGKHSQELKVGDKLSTLSGDKYIVNTIEKYDGEHNTYTISTQYNNFYANDILVDSEI